MGVQKPKSILIIGGGPSGLATLHNLVSLGSGFDRVQLVERRSDVGGVWYRPDSSTNPSEDPFPSPAYPGLVGNVWPEFLSFSGHPKFPKPELDNGGFPTLAETWDYLKEYARPLAENGLIRTGIEVVKVAELQSAVGWSVTSRDLTQNGRESEEVWDAVVFCVNWYENPVWPDVPGLDVLRKEGIAKHSKWWKGVEENHSGKRILIIGNSNSGNDITSALTFASPPPSFPLYQSVRHPSFIGISHPRNDPRVTFVPAVREYRLNSSSKAEVVLEDGAVLEDIDEIQVSTGYRPNPDLIFVRSGASDADTLHPIMQDPKPWRIPALYRHILWAHNPTLAFIGSSVASYTPFVVADVQSAWLATIWSHSSHIALPTDSDQSAFDARLTTSKRVVKDLALNLKNIKEGNQFTKVWAINFLGETEDEYLALLRRDIVAAHPELENEWGYWKDENKESDAEALGEDVWPIARKRRDAMWNSKREYLRRALELRT